MSYSTLIAAALRLITTNGVACTWKSTNPVVDTSEPWKEQTAIESEYSTYVVLLPFDSSARRMFGYADGSPVANGTLLGYVPGSEVFVPSLRDTIEVGTKTYTIGAFDSINPDADKDIVYVLELHQ